MKCLHIHNIRSSDLVTMDKTSYNGEPIEELKEGQKPCATAEANSFSSATTRSQTLRLQVEKPPQGSAVVAKRVPIEVASPDLSFPWRLFIMLDHAMAEEGGLGRIVSWIAQGTAFKVHMQDEFTKTILPRYFRMKKYNSFTRALCAYEFTWIRSGASKGGCESRAIVCGRRDVCSNRFVFD